MSSSSDKPGTDQEDASVSAYASPPCYQHELDPDYLGSSGLPDIGQPGPDSSWAAIRTWRVKARSRLVEFRKGFAAYERKRRSTNVVQNLQSTGILAQHKKIGFYWPMAGEIDLRPLLSTLAEQGVEAALPVIIAKNQPLEFWRWHPGDVLDDSGPMGIPVPATRQRVEVTALLIPLLGFDARGHRLGHGGGYYDRTLAAMDPRPFAIGVGMDDCRLPSIYPQAHDMPMDVIVTDANVYEPQADAASTKPVSER